MTTTTLTTTATHASAPVTATAMALASATPTEIDDLLLFGKQHTQQHLELLQAVKSELKLEESDNKSQYEESVVQPPTPPESYTTNDEKLLDTLTEHELSSASLPATLEEANAKLHLRSNQSDNKMTVPVDSRQQAAPQHMGNSCNNAPSVLEAYDLTSVTETPPPPPSTPTSTATTNCSSTTNATTTTTTTNCAALPLLGRKARIGKTMAREMVYAGAAAAANVTAQAHTTPMIHVRTLPQQPHAIAQPQQQLQQPPTQAQPQQQTQTQFLTHQPEQLLTAITPSPSPQVPATLSDAFPAAESGQPPFILKTEIKAEKIKLEDDEPLLNAVLQMQQQQESNHNQDKDNEKVELKLIKAEPVTLTCEEVSAAMSDVMDTPSLKQLGRMRLLPSWQQPPIIDIDLSTTSDDDVLDLCHSPATSTSGSCQKSRLKILNLPKAQLQSKKSSPNGYKSLIKQAEPRTYLCLSGRKLDKRGRYSKLQLRQTRVGGVNGTIRRRQLVLTDKQKKQLKLCKKKLQAQERRRQEAIEKRRAAAKQERLQRRKLQKQSNALSAIKQEDIEPCVDEIVDLVEEPEQTESEFSETTQTDVPTMRMLLTESSSNSNSSSSLNTLKMTPKPSPKRGKTARKTCIPLHLIETIDSVARGYFSEPETSRCSGTLNQYTNCDASDVTEQPLDKAATERKQKKDKKASAEKRSKSETKKPIKTTIATAVHTTEPVDTIDVSYPLMAATARSAQTTSITETALDACSAESSNTALDLTQDTEEATGTSLEELLSSKSSTNKAKSSKSKRTPAKRKTAKAKKSKKPKSNKKKLRQQDWDYKTNALEICEEAPLPITEQLALETNNNIYDKCNAESAAVEQVADRQTQMVAEAELDETPALQESMQEPQQHAQSPDKHSNAQVFLPPVPPMPRIVCQPHHGTKRTRSRSKFGSRKRQKVKHSTVSFELDVRLPPATRGDVAPKWNNGWTWEGEPFQGAVFLNSDDPLVIRTCYPAMRHSEGDIIRTRDCVLLKANEDNDLPYVAKVAHIWENPEDGEMMMSLLWYYRPEHTEQGRQPNDSPDEVYASRHRDHNSVACIEDKCYVLTFSEYCRYRRRLRAAEEDIEEEVSIVPKRSTCYSIRTVPENTNPELVMFCRRAYEFRTRRLLKMPNKQDYIVVNG